MNLWLLQHLPVATFIFAAGAIVGSFINVVIYRLPAGMSVISPPSRCPTCGDACRGGRTCRSWDGFWFEAGARIAK